MSKQSYLGEFEHLVLLAVLRLRDNAYGVTIRQEIEDRTGRSPSLGAIYVTLERLEQKRYVSSWMGDPTSERGGRAKRFFCVEASGRVALAHSRESQNKMWSGLKREGLAS